MKETIDGKEYTIGTPEWAQAVRDFAAKQVQAEKGRADGAERIAAQVKKDLDAANDPKKRQETIARRVRLITDCARAAKSAGVRFDEAAAAGMAEGDMILQGIKLLDPSFNPEGQSPEFLFGYFQALIKGMGAEEAAEGETTGLDGAAEKQPPPGAPAPAPGAPDPTKKTDSKSTPSIFDVRRGTEPGTKREDSAGPDPDKARQDMIDRDRDAWKKPLAASKK